MSILLVEIFDSKLEIIRNAALDFFNQVLFALFSEVHNNNIF